MTEKIDGGIIAFDPGDTTGWAAFSGEGDTKMLGQVKFDDLPGFLASMDETKISYVIVEDYRLFAKRAMQQAGSTMKASQVIGMLTLWAAQKGAELVKQPSSIKPAALKWSQIKMPGSHAQSHQYDAYLHGYHWMVSRGLIKTQLQLEMEAKGGK